MIVSPQKKAGSHQYTNAQEEDLLTIKGVLYETMEMDLISHQLIFETIPVSMIGLVEFDEDDLNRDSETSSSTDKNKQKNRSNKPDWSQIGRAIVKYFERLTKTSIKMVSYFDYPIVNLGWQFRNLRVVPVGHSEEVESEKLAQSPNTDDLITSPELLHSEKSVIQGQKYLLRIYQQVVSLKKIENLFEKGYFSTMVAKWVEGGVNGRRNNPVEHLCLTRSNPRIVVLEYPLEQEYPSENTQPYNPIGKVQPEYKLDQIWQYIDIVEDRKIVFGLRYLKEVRKTQERVVAYYDWNRQVIMLNIIDLQPSIGLLNKSTVELNDRQVAIKIYSEGRDIERIMQDLLEVVVMSRADEIQVGPKLFERYEVRVTREFKPSYFSFVQRCVEFHNILIAPLQSANNIQLILRQLCQNVHRLHKQGVVHNALSVKSVMYSIYRKCVCLTQFGKSKVLRHTYPFRQIQDQSEEGQYLSKLQHFEASQYSKDIQSIGKLIDHLFNTYELSTKDFYSQIAHFERMSEKSLKELKSDYDRVQNFVKFVQELDKSQEHRLLEPKQSLKIDFEQKDKVSVQNTHT